MHNNLLYKREVATRGRLSKTNRVSAPEQREQLQDNYKPVEETLSSLSGIEETTDAMECSSPLLANSSSPTVLPPVKSLESSQGYDWAAGNRHHLRSEPVFNFRTSGQYAPEVSEMATYQDEIITRHCIVALVNLIGRRVSQALVDLVGIEPNPGPGKKGSKQLLSNLLSSLKGKKRIAAEKKGKAKVRASKRNLNNVGASNMLTSAPASFGFVAPKSYFRTSANVQQLATQDPRSGVRVSGCALFGSPIQTFNATGSGASTNIGGGFAGSSSPSVAFAYLTPNSIDPRLAAIAETYQWNSLRRAVIRWIPSVATSTSGTIYLGISKDAYAASVSYASVGSASPSPGNQQGILDMDPALMSTIWQPAMMDFVHRGTQLWETYSNTTEDVLERIQAALVCIVQSNLTINTTQFFGNLWIEYEWDFYVPGPPQGSN